MTTVGEEASELAPMLRPVVDDVGHDQPPRDGRLVIEGERLSERGTIERPHVGQQSRVFLGANVSTLARSSIGTRSHT